MPGVPEFAHQRAQQRDAQTDHRVRVAVDALDVPGALGIDCERPGDGERLAGGDVGLQLVVVDVGGELDARHGRGADGGDGGALAHLDEPVAGVKVPGPAALRSPALERHLGMVRLAVDLAADLERRVSAEDEAAQGGAGRIDRALGDRFGLEACEQLHHIGSGQRPAERRLGVAHGGLFVDARRERDRLDSDGAQRGESCGGGGGEVETEGCAQGSGHRDSYAHGMSSPRSTTATHDSAPPREVELDVTNIAHGGVAVARHEGRVVFVADAIPGERVLAHITDDSKDKFWRADTVRVLEASPHRQAHVWPEADVDRDPRIRPGGAEFGHITLAHQRELKASVLREALARMAKASRDVEVEALPGNPDGTGWRTRVRLHVASDGTVGPFASRSHRVIRVSSLPLATEAVREVAPLDERYPELAQASAPKPRGRRRGPANDEAHIDVLAPSVGGARMIIGKQARSVIRERVGDREFRVDDAGFWQVHEAAPQTLTEAVQSGIVEDLFDPKAANLDLYGGVGLLAAAVGDKFGSSLRITSVESDERATEHAAENLADWIGAHTVTARVEQWVRSLADASATERARLSAATVVLDPPRSGAGRSVLDALTELRPAQFVYVACDPVAFARDVATLQESGYRLDRLRAFDLFPHTHHVEAVGTLVRV